MGVFFLSWSQVSNVWYTAGGDRKGVQDMACQRSPLQGVGGYPQAPQIL